MLTVGKKMRQRKLEIRNNEKLMVKEGDGYMEMKSRKKSKVLFKIQPSNEEMNCFHIP